MAGGVFCAGMVGSFAVVWSLCVVQLLEVCRSFGLLR